MIAIKILAGFILDLAFGDPYDFPHPVRMIGRSITALEGLLRKTKYERLAGIILTVVVVCAAYVLTYYIASISAVIEIILIYTVLAMKCLADEARSVYDALDADDIAEARRRISFLVSRDTAHLDEKGIVRAAVETVSENIVDGIISPIFYLFIGGVPLAMAYKAASTLDSMVGYRNEKYIRFGWAGARLDDVLNFIPARITAFFLLPAAAFICGQDAKGALRIARRDRLKHASPNSAHAEAAVAGALGCRLGGPSVYFGKLAEKPYIGEGRAPGRADILKAAKLMYAASFVALITGCVAVVIVKIVQQNMAGSV